jgi:SAM-dependent methyltransferase
MIATDPRLACVTPEPGAAAPPVARPVPSPPPFAGRLSFRDVHSRAEFHALLADPVWQERREFEEHLLRQQGEAESFVVPGFSMPAGQYVGFLIDRVSAGPRPASGPWVPNWRERLLCPVTDLNNRQRAVAWLLADFLAGRRAGAAEPKVYLLEQVTPFYQWASQRFGPGNLVGSEWLGHDVPRGAVVRGVRHEDVQDLSFADRTFDAIVSQDVMEHIPDPWQGFREQARVLKPGGRLFLSVPFYGNNDDSRPRARLRGGQLEHLLPPEYHGNPVDPKGSLVFTDYGWDLLTRLGDCGFSRAFMRVYWSFELGHLGGPQFLFVAAR